MFQRDWLILRDTSGTIVARWDDWISFGLVRRMNAPDQATLMLNGKDDRVLLFGLDYILEFWRENKEANIEAYREAALFHRTPQHKYDERGQLTFTSRSVGFEDLLARRIILNYTGIDRTKKSGVAETVIKDYVDEQAGPGATTGAGRLFSSGVTTGLSIEADAAAGDNWEGDMSYRNLLDVLQEIAEGKAMAFRVDALDLTVPTFIFRAYERPYGADRSSTGIVAATGRNAAGNLPVVFSDQSGTAIAPSYAISRDREANVAIVLGRGNEGERILREVEIAGTAYDTDSPWNRREIAVQSIQNSENAALDNEGLAKLETTIPQTIVEVGEIVQHPSLLYGKDYFLGDIVTVRVGGLEVNRTISSVRITVEARGEQMAEAIDLELAE